MRVLCIGDSLGLPCEECAYENTWFYCLKETFKEYEFVDFFLRGLEIKDALHRYDTYFQFYKAEIAIIQTGIVDCAPRFIRENKRSVKFIIFLFRRIGLEKVFWKIIKKGGRKENCVYTDFEAFQSAYSQLVSKLMNNGVKKVILVKIGHATDIILEKNPSFNKNADKYNKVIESIYEKDPNGVVVVNPLHDVSDDDFVDGYHCNPKGMTKVYQALRREIENYVAKR